MSRSAPATLRLRPPPRPVADDLPPGGLVCEIDERRRQHVIVRAAGEIDLATADLLGTRIRGARAGDVTRITVDLRGVSFLDSCGMRVLLGEAQSTAATGRVALDVVANDFVHDVLRLAGVHRRLRFSQGWVLDRAIEPVR